MAAYSTRSAWAAAQVGGGSGGSDIAPINGDIVASDDGFQAVQADSTPPMSGVITVFDPDA